MFKAKSWRQTNREWSEEITLSVWLMGYKKVYVIGTKNKLFDFPFKLSFFWNDDSFCFNPYLIHKNLHWTIWQIIMNRYKTIGLSWKSSFNLYYIIYIILINKYAISFLFGTTFSKVVCCKCITSECGKELTYIL